MMVVMGGGKGKGDGGYGGGGVEGVWWGEWCGGDGVGRRVRRWGGASRGKEVVGGRGAGGVDGRVW